MPWSATKQFYFAPLAFWKYFIEICSLMFCCQNQHSFPPAFKTTCLLFCSSSFQVPGFNEILKFPLQTQEQQIESADSLQIREQEATCFCYVSNYSPWTSQHWTNIQMYMNVVNMNAANVACYHKRTVTRTFIYINIQHFQSFLTSPSTFSI